MMTNSKPIRWGILGTGFVAQKFAQGLRWVPDSQLLAVGSRTLQSAQTFSRQFKVPKTYGAYSDLVNDPEIDIVYVATPHIRHQADCILCLEAGKAVLCEKPFTVNAQEAREVVALARQRNLFCMEAMWMRYMPLIQTVKDLVNSGEIGSICLLTADFGYPVEFDPSSRFFKLDLGGGALLDRGIYPISLAFHLLGAPSHVVGQASIGKTGVDEQSAIVFNYENGALALLSSTLNTYASNTATVIGTQGKIVIHDPFYQPEKISITKFSKPRTTSSTLSLNQTSTWQQSIIHYLKRHGILRRLISKLRRSVPKTLSHRNQGNGYNYEAQEAVRCLRMGVLESPIMPLDESIKMMEMMDALRQQWHLIYPNDRQSK